MASDNLRERKKVAWRTQFAADSENRENCRLVKGILKKDPSDRSKKDLEILKELEVLVTQVEDRARKQAKEKKKEEEVLDPEDVLDDKVNQLVEAIKEATSLVVYTGAGISTAACIPDYRSYNLSDAKPTLSHMSLMMLHKVGLVRHVVSQNCDGLHIRSGLPREALSEVHGNMFTEVCTECYKERLYFRLFDVTERTSLRRHQTGRYCYECGALLRDTIVHFGEKGCLEQPLNWQGALDAAKVADCILCLGSSLKVLKRYHALWGMNRARHRRPKLFIVNLQVRTDPIFATKTTRENHRKQEKAWTPKDEVATLKLNARCDDVMAMVIKRLDLDTADYRRSGDPLFTLATPLQPHEYGSYRTKLLIRSENLLHMDPLDESPSLKFPGLKEEPEQHKSENSNQENKHNSEEDNSDNSTWRDDKTAFITCPGWYGKGYGKTKRPTKRRKVR